MATTFCEICHGKFIFSSKFEDFFAILLKKNIGTLPSRDSFFRRPVREYKTTFLLPNNKFYGGDIAKLIIAMRAQKNYNLASWTFRKKVSGGSFQTGV